MTLTGRDSLNQRQAAQDAFQEGTARVFIGNIKAAGEGITLAAASHCLFVEQDWSPGVMDQAAARIETHDRSRTLTVDYLVRRGGIDSKLMAKLDEKRQIIAEALNDQ